MMLVPEDVFIRLEQRQKIESSPIVTNMIKTDQEMSNILHRTDIDDAQKQKLYNANLERFINLRQQKNEQIPTVRVAMKKNTEKDGGENSTLNEVNTLPDFVIVDNIPIRQCVREQQHC